MSDFADLTRKMFETIRDIQTGRFVYVVASGPGGGGGVSIEDVICDETSIPQLALERHCKSKGIPQKGLLCLPVILPPGLQPVAVKGFRPVRTATALWIEYTGEK